MVGLSDDFDDLARRMSTSERLRFSDAVERARQNGAQISVLEGRFNELRNEREVIQRSTRQVYVLGAIILFIPIALQFTDIMDPNGLFWGVALIGGLIIVQQIDSQVFQIKLEEKRIRLQIEILEAMPYIRDAYPVDMSEGDRKHAAAAIKRLFDKSLNENARCLRRSDYSHLDPPK